MIVIYDHLEENTVIGVKSSSDGCKTLCLGDNLTFMSDAQAEILFDNLDKQLHKKTYCELQDDCFNLDVDLQNANEEVERLSDEVMEYQAI